MSAWETQRAQLVVVRLPRCVPETEVDQAAINFEVGRVLVKNDRDVESGTALVVYAWSRQVLPTAPSPRVTTLIASMTSWLVLGGCLMCDVLLHENLRGIKGGPRKFLVLATPICAVTQSRIGSSGEVLSFF